MRRGGGGGGSCGGAAVAAARAAEAAVAADVLPQPLTAKVAVVVPDLTVIRSPFATLIVTVVVVMPSVLTPLTV